MTGPNVQQENRNDKNRCDVILIIMTALAATLPFLHQAHDIDDPFTLYLADNIIESPLSPLDGRSFWFQEPGLLAAEYLNPPLAGYLAAPIVFIFQHQAIPLHVLFSIWYVLAGLFFYGLARRFVRQAFLLTIIFIFIPAMIVQAHHIMPDMLCLSLFLGGIWAIIRGIEQHEQFWFPLAGLLGGLSALAKYHGLLWVPIMLVLLWSARRKVSRRAIVFLVINGILPITIWMLWQTKVYGDVHRMAVLSAINWTPTELLVKLQALITHMGAALPVLIIAVLSHQWAQWSKWALVILAISSVTLVSLIDSNWRWLPLPSLVAMAIFFCLGLLAFIILFRGLPAVQKKRVEETDRMEETDWTTVSYRFLFNWFVISFVGTLMMAPFIASRYLLLGLPPLTIMLASLLFGLKATEQAQSSATLSHSHKSFRGHLLVWSSVFIGFMISIGDFQFSKMTHDIADAIASRYADQNSVFFTGHWGFQHAMEQHGLTAWEPGKAMESGTLIIRPHQWSRQVIDEKVLERTVLIERFTIQGKIPITIMDPWLSVGFYYHRHRPVPWLLCLPSEITVDIMQYHGPHTRNSEIP